MAPVIACSHSLYLPKAVWDTRLRMLRSAQLPRRMEVLGCIACQHRFGPVTEKGRRKVVHPSRGERYSLPLHTSPRTVEENTCLGEEVGGPRRLGVYVCMQGAFPRRLAKPTHQRVRHVDEMAPYYPSCNTDQGDYYACEDAS